ncbi:MAG: cytidine deaminase [Kiritimatiellales bacterium]|nr:cytidine deaminase [Kiritimatiellales bacterium]MCF7864653.1 cytidine deaminase [Kiritimatiellales bacterium]
MTPDELIALAVKALENAYAPYSNYRVGAALLCADGTVFTGCNIENSSYGLTNCAERTAIFSAVAAGQTDFAAIAIAASGEPVPFPCGACRQVLSEFCGSGFSVYVQQPGGPTATTLGELLPHAFDLKMKPPLDHR